MGFVLTTSIDAENPVLHDLKLVNGQLSFVLPSLSDPDSYSIDVAQRIVTRLRFEQGEWFLDQRKGTPWKTRVLGKSGVILGLDQVREMIYDVVYNTPGVESVGSIELDADYETRVLTVSVSAFVATSQEISVADLQVPFQVAA